LLASLFHAQAFQDFDLFPDRGGVAPIGDVVDLASVFAAAEVSVDGHMVSSNLTYFVSAKQVQLPPTQVVSSLAKKGDGYDVTLKSPTLARSVYRSTAKMLNPMTTMSTCFQGLAQTFM
jgi:hypothetical protein